MWHPESQEDSCTPKPHVPVSDISELPTAAAAEGRVMGLSLQACLSQRSPAAGSFSGVKSRETRGKV